MGDEIKRDKLAIYLCRIYAKLTYAGERKDEDENRGEKKTEGKREWERRGRIRNNKGGKI